MSEILPICPTDCSGLLPEVNFSACAPVFTGGRIKRLYIGKPTDSSFNDWTTDTEWQARIDQAANTAGTIRAFVIIGTLPAPTETVLPMSEERPFVVTKERKMTFKIDDLSDENREFLRTTECGMYVKAWYATDDFLFGGNDGIYQNASLTMNEIIPEDNKQNSYFEGTLTWTAKVSPKRTKNPLT